LKEKRSEETESPLDNSYAQPVVEKGPEAHKDVFTEADLQVKIADLGNACWTVIDLI
jgi:hypothetical protein